MSDTILKFLDVGKTFTSASGELSVALQPVNVEIRRGEFVSLVGPSGCGKTTLLKMAAGLISATTGEIQFDSKQNGMRSSDFGMAFQTPAMFPWRTILKNVALPAEIAGNKNKEMMRRAESLLGMMQISDVRDKYPSELSGGMLQRAAIARSMINDPDVLLMDEPFGALDAMTREQLNDELQQLHLAHGKTVVFVTHGIQEAVFLSDRIIVLSGKPGEMVADITVPLPRPRRFEERTSAAAKECEAEVREALESIKVGS